MLSLPQVWAATADAGATSGATPAGSIGIQLLEAPVSLENNARAYRYVIDHLAPGVAIHRKIRITNTSGEPQHIDLYAAAATIGGGTFHFAPNRTPNELTDWISLAPASCDLPAGGNMTFEAAITVPRSASSGERYAVIWAQDTSAARRGGVRMINRVGVRVYLDVGPGGEPVSDFRIDSLIGMRTANGTPEVVAEVRNTGGRALDMSGTLWLTNGPGSLGAGPFAADLGTTLGINQTEPVTVPLDERLPDGPWTAHLTLVSGVTQHSITTTVTFPGGVGVSQPASNASPWYFLVLEIAGGVVLVLLLCALVYRRVRRRAAPPP
jgi:hypothetical protein